MLVEEFLPLFIRNLFDADACGGKEDGDERHNHVEYRVGRIFPGCDTEHAIDEDTARIPRDEDGGQCAPSSSARERFFECRFFSI